MSKPVFRTLLALSLALVAGAAVAAPFLPASVPSHWNFAGEVDGYSSKYLWLFLCALPLAITFGLRVLPRVDPKLAKAKEAGQPLGKAYDVTCVVTVAAIMVISLVGLLAALGVAIPMERVIPGMVGALLVGIGNYMPQIKPSYFMGVRTPWTLSSDVVWRKTHRAAGILFCGCGIVLAFGIIFTTPILIIVVVGLLLTGCIALWPYSWRIYKKLDSMEK